VENENKSLIEQAVEHMNEMSAKAHYKKFKKKGVVPGIDRNRYPNKEKQGLEGPYRSKKSGKIFYYDKKAGKYYDTDSDMYLSVDDVMEHFDPENPEYDPEMSEMNIGEAKEPAHFTKKRDDGTYSVLKNHPRGAMGMSHGHDKATADRLVTKHNKSAEVRSRRDAGIPDVAGKYKGQRLFAGKKNEEVEQVDEVIQQYDHDNTGQKVGYTNTKLSGDQVSKLRKKYPQGSVEKDNDGNHVVYTGQYKKKNEEVEQVDENYEARKIMRKIGVMGVISPNGEIKVPKGDRKRLDTELKKNKIKNYTISNESFEQVDELDAKTMKSYIGKAQKDNTNRVARMADKPSHMKADKGEMDKLRKRQKGVVKAKTDLDMRSIAGKDYRKRMGEQISDEDAKRMGIEQPLKGKGFPYNEDIEQVDELKKATIMNYKDKARAQITRDKYGDFGKVTNKTNKRAKGVDKATKKLVARQYDEEVELDELKMPAKDERGRARDPEVRKAYSRGAARADLKAGGKLRKGDADGAENPMSLARKRQSASRTPMDEAPKIKVKLNPEKKIGYKIQSVGPGGKKITTKMRDWPGKKDVGENVSDLDKSNPEPTAKEMNKALNDKEYDKKLDAIHKAKKNK